MTEATIAYYEEMRALATTAGPPEIQSQSLADQLMITILRVDPGPDRLDAMDGTDVFAFGVEQGLIGTEAVQNAALGEVEVSGEVATAPVLDDSGAPTEFSWEFRNEGGAWKLDVAALIPLSNLVLEDQAKQAGLPVDEFVLQVAGSSTGMRLTPAIWEAPK